MRDLVDAGPIAIGTVLAKPGDAAIDETLAQRLIVDAETMLDVGAVVLDHHIGAFRQTMEDRAPLRLLEVERNGPLVAVQVLKVEAVTSAPEILGLVGVRGRLDLDDIGAPIGEMTHAGWPRTRPRQVKHLEASKRQAGQHVTPSEFDRPNRCPPVRDAILSRMRRERKTHLLAAPVLHGSRRSRVKPRQPRWLPALGFHRRRMVENESDRCHDEQDDDDDPSRSDFAKRLPGLIAHVEHGRCLVLHHGPHFTGVRKPSRLAATASAQGSSLV